MILKRLIYAIILAVSLAIFILTDSGIALFICICLFVLPLISFILLFFAAGRTKFSFEVRESCMRGAALQITMRAEVKPRFLVGQMKCRVKLENTTFAQTVLKTFLFRGLDNSPYTYDFVSDNSGRISVSFPKLVLIDLFGIFSLKVKCGQFAEATVSPVLYEDLQISLSDSYHASQSGERSLPRKGDDRTEIYNIRDYAAGDPLNAVHWKLSGKFDTIKSKECGATDDNRTLILVDTSRIKNEKTATDEQLNAVFDIAAAVSESLKSGGFLHSIGWVNDGTPTLEEVCDNDSFVHAVHSLMSCKVDAGNAQSLFYFSLTAEGQYFNKIILVAPFVDDEELRRVTFADITAIVADGTDGEITDNGIKIYHVPYGKPMLRQTVAI